MTEPPEEPQDECKTLNVGDRYNSFEVTRGKFKIIKEGGRLFMECVEDGTLELKTDVSQQTTKPKGCPYPNTCKECIWFTVGPAWTPGHHCQYTRLHRKKGP